MNDDIRESAYKTYITESLYAFGDGKRLKLHYHEIIDPKKMQNTRSPQDILDSIQKALQQGGES